MKHLLNGRPSFAPLVAALLFGLLAVHQTGCKTETISSGNNALLVNNSNAIDPRSVPPGFESVNANLLSKPLANAEAGPSEKLFSRVASDTVRFSNTFSRDMPFLLLETGSGVALGDYDNDGLTDIYLIGSDVSNQLYRNLGNFEFENVTLDANVSGNVSGKPALGSGATFGDIDNDGDLDLFLCNMDAPNLLYVNQGDGTFLEQSNLRGLSYRGASKTAAFCDYDQDGDLDIYLLTYQDLQPSREPKWEEVDGKKVIAEEDRNDFVEILGTVEFAGERDTLYENQGDGTFKDVTEKAGLVAYCHGLGCAWFDYDGDGWQDLYVGSDFKTPDHFYRNNGNGTFTDVTAKCFRHTPWYAMGLDTGDLNNDGLLDLMIGDMSATTHYKQKVSMGSMGDSAAFLDYGSPRQYMKNVLHINSGMGKFFEVAAMTGTSSTDWTWAIRFADVDNNGLQDILVTNGHARDSMNSDLTQKFKALHAKEADKEEFAELYRAIPPLKEVNLAFRNNGGLQFEKAGSDWGLDHNGISHGLAMADFDNDGDLDLVMNNLYERATVYRNDSVNGERIILDFRCDKNNHFGYGTKVEIWQGDQYQTKTLFPARGYLASDEPILHFGLTSADPISRLKVTWPDRTTQEFEKISVGMRYRILESESRKSPESIAAPPTLFSEIAGKVGLEFEHNENEFNDYAREPLLPYQLSKLGGSVAISDINGDGKPDVFCGGASSQAGQLFLSQGESYDAVDGPWTDDAQQEDMGVLFFDADNDGDLDLYIASGGTECEANDDVLQDRLYINSSTKDSINFEKSADALPKFNQNSSSVCAADFDRDGDLDLFVGSRSIPGNYPLTPTSQLLINEDGKFAMADESVSNGLAEVGLVNSAIWSDIDGDHWVDLIVALDWGPVTVYRNVDGSLNDVTEEVGLADRLGWWHGIAASDIDGDGDMDFVVTNQGHNTKYHADAKHPHRLYYHDFDGSGSIDLVETKFEGDRELPVRGRSCSSHAMPFIKEKFETFESFALADLTEIYEPEICDRNSKEINWMDTSIIWNDKGTFRVEPLPYLAQISPAFGVSAADFDHDGVVDLMIANNFFPNQVETGFMDGGLSWFMKGKKTDSEQSPVSFEAIWPNQSGIALDGDSNGLATADVDGDGDRDTLVSENSGQLRVLRNDSVQADLVAILARTGKGSPAVGSRVTLIGPASKRSFDVSAGGSYLSQSDANTSIVLSREELEAFDSIKIVWPDGTESNEDLQSVDGNQIVFSK